MAEEPGTPALPCPECRLQGHGGKARIGNHRNTCKVCNAFAQGVMRLTRARLLERHPEEYTELRVKAELELYPKVLERFLEKYPTAREVPGAD